MFRTVTMLEELARKQVVVVLKSETSSAGIKGKISRLHVSYLNQPSSAGEEELKGRLLEVEVEMGDGTIIIIPAENIAYTKHHPEGYGM